MKCYILDENKKAVLATSEEWALFFELDNRKVARDDGVNGYDVSTVFLGIDHNYNPEGPPLLFETMVFGTGGLDDVCCVRCSTWEQAEAQHAKVLQMVKDGRIEEVEDTPLDLDNPPYAPVAPEDMWTGRVAQIYIPFGFDNHGRKT